jgi:hypothetical protein
LALAGARSGRQRHRLLRPSPRPVFPRCHAPDSPREIRPTKGGPRSAPAISRGKPAHKSHGWHRRVTTPARSKCRIQPKNRSYDGSVEIRQTGSPLRCQCGKRKRIRRLRLVPPQLRAKADSSRRSFARRRTRPAAASSEGGWQCGQICPAGAMRPQRGYLAAKYDARPATCPKTLRHQFDEKYDLKIVRHTYTTPCAASPAHKTTPCVVAIRHPFGKNPGKMENPPATTRVWENPGTAPEESQPARAITTLRPKRGNLVAKGDASAGQLLKSP